MNYHSVIGPLSLAPGTSPLVDAFSAGRFPAMEAVPNDSLSPFESYGSLPSIRQSARMQAPRSQFLHPRLQQQQSSLSPLPPAQSPFTPSQSQAQRPPSTSSSNNTNHSTPKEKRSRWSLAGRLFEKRKSIPVSSNIPNMQPKIAATASGHDAEKIASSSNTSGSRRSSLVDIPKALLSSLRRASLTSSSEPKEKPSKSFQRHNLSNTSIDNDEGTDQSSDVEGSSAGNEAEVIPTTTIMTTNGPSQATLIPPKEPSSSNADQLHAHSAKGILKETPSFQETSNSITDDSLIPTRVESVNPPPPSLLVSDNAHPLALSDKNLDINLFGASDHWAQLVVFSPIPGPHPHPHQQLHQQQEQQQYLSDPFAIESIPQVTGLASPVPFKPSGFDLEPRSTQGAAIPPEFTPGVQSNTYQDRGGERSHGMVIDPHVGDGIYANFAQIHRQHHPHHHQDPFAMSGGFTYPSRAVEDVSNDEQYLDPSEADLASYQRSSIGSQGSDDSMFEPLEAAVMETQHRRYTEGDIAMPMMRELDSHSEFNHSFPSGPRSSMDSGSEGSGGRRKCISFTDTVEIIPVHRKSEYNRRSDRNATFRVLTPGLKAIIREELNNYKMREMAVHVRSMGNTAFH
ncbi:hypothetical protein BGX26_011353 [Mortierella sp. AD094]|nr:hypothetical protein BGX26_011353 [Mortierella sp. AD094]